MQLPPRRSKLRFLLVVAAVGLLPTSAPGALAEQCEAVVVPLASFEAGGCGTDDASGEPGCPRTAEAAGESRSQQESSVGGHVSRPRDVMLVGVSAGGEHTCYRSWTETAEYYDEDEQVYGAAYAAGEGVGARYRGDDTTGCFVRVTYVGRAGARSQDIDDGGWGTALCPTGIDWGNVLP